MKPGDWYGDKTQGHAMFRVVCLATLFDRVDYPAVVVYEDRSGQIWAQPLDEFLERYERLTP